MSRSPYLLARACTLEDERYFHRRDLVHRLRVLACGGELRFVYAQVARRRGRVTGPCLAVKVIEPCGHEAHLGYVLREGLAVEDMKERLQAEIDKQARATCAGVSKDREAA